MGLPRILLCIRKGEEKEVEGLRRHARLFPLLLWREEEEEEEEEG